MLRRIIQLRDVLLAERAHAFGRITQPQFAATHGFARRNDRAGADEAVVFDHRTIEHGGAHADQAGVADAAGEGVGVAGEVGLSDTDVELREGESLEDLRARLKPRKKSGISAEMLDTANSYDDKVTVVRMLVSQDAKRVALVLKNLITRDIR